MGEKARGACAGWGTHVSQMVQPLKLWFIAAHAEVSIPCSGPKMQLPCHCLRCDTALLGCWWRRRLPLKLVIQISSTGALKQDEK